MVSIPKFLLFLVSTISLNVYISLGGELEELLDKITQNFTINLHKHFERQRITDKLESNTLFNIRAADELTVNHFKVGSSVSVRTPASLDSRRILTWTIVPDIETTYLFAAKDDGSLVFARFDARTGNIQVLRESPRVAPLGAVAQKSGYFQYQRRLYVVLLYKQYDASTKYVSSQFLTVYRIEKGFHRIQVIESNGHTDFDVITRRGYSYLVISTSVPNSGHFDSEYGSQLKLYEWKRTQFDMVAELKTSSVSSVRLFGISSTIYVATAQESHEGSKWSLVDKKGSFVFRYNRKEALDLLNHVQIIQVESAKVVRHFVVSGNNYLIFIGQKDAQIVWWNGHQFMDYQKLKGTKGAKDVSVMHLPNAEVVICLLFETSVKFFTEQSDSEYVVTYERHFGPHELRGLSVKNIELFSFRRQYFYAWFTISQRKDPYGHTSPFNPMWRLELEHYQSSATKDNPLDTCLRHLYDRMIQRHQKLKEISARADSIWYRNKPQMIKAPVIVSGKVFAPNKTYVTNIRVKAPKNRNVTLMDAHIRQKLYKASHSAQRINNNFQNVVLKSKPNQVIRGFTQFKNTIEAGVAEINRISNSDVRLNGVPFSVLGTRALTMHGHQVITGKWSVKDFQVDDLRVAGRLNDILPREILRVKSNTTQIINGTLHFENIVAENNLMVLENGTFNDFKIHEIVTPKGVHLITGHKHFKSVSAPAVLVTDIVNNARINALAAKAVRINSKSVQVIGGPIIFQAPHLQVSHLSHRLINGKVNLSHLINFSVSKSKPQTIFGANFHEGLSVDNLLVDGPVNGIRLPADVLTTNTDQNVYGKLVFQNEVRFGGNVMPGRVNGVPLMAEAVKRHSNHTQVILSRKSFNGNLTINGHLTMDDRSTIDGVDPSRLPHFMYSKEAVFDGQVVIDSLSVLGEATLRSGVNGRRLTDLPYILWQKSKPQTIPTSVKFPASIEVGSINVGVLNGGLRVPESFVHKSSPLPQRVLAPKLIQRAQLEHGPFEFADRVPLNNHNLKRLSFLAVKNDHSENRTILGTKSLRSLEVKGNVYAKRINGLVLEKDVMISGLPQVVGGSIKFKAPVIIDDQLSVSKNLILASTIGGVKLKEWSSDVVTGHPSGYLTLSGKHFKALHALSMKTAGKISGVDFESLKNNVVTLNTRQVISAPMEFANDVYFNTVNATLVNNLRLAQLHRQLVFKQNPLGISGTKLLMGSVTVKNNLVIDGTVNQVNIRKEASRAAYKHSSNIFQVPVMFGSTLRVKNLELSPEALLDGVPVSNLVLLNQGSHINGKVVFSDDLGIGGNLVVSSDVVNNCHLGNLYRQAVLLNGSHFTQTLTSSKSFSLLNVQGSLQTMDGDIDGINLRNLSRDAAWAAEKKTLFGAYSFRDKVTVDILEVRSTINRHDVSFILRDAVLKSLPNTITGQKYFMNNVTVDGHIFIHGNWYVKGFINGVNVVKLNQTVVRKFSNQVITGVKSFSGPQVSVSGDLTVIGPINGLYIPNDLILATGQDFVSRNTVFRSQTIIQGNLNVRGRVDGKNLGHWARDRFTLSGRQISKTKLAFEDRVNIKHLIVRKSINKIPVLSLVTNNGNHELHGKITIVQDVLVDGNAHFQKINGISLHELMARRVSLRKPEYIPGSTVFGNTIKIGNQIRALRLNGVSVPQLDAAFRNLSLFLNGTTRALHLTTLHNQEVLRKQFDAMVHQRSSLEYFQIWHEFGIRDKKDYSIMVDRFLSSRFMYYDERLSFFYYPVPDKILMWVLNKKFSSRDCFKYSTLTLKVSNDGNLDDRVTPQIGRHFPAISPADGFGEFHLWTNTTGCLYSGQKTDQISEEKTVFMSLQIDDVGKKRYTEKVKVNSSHISGVLTDAKFFDDGHDTYAVIAYGYHKGFETGKTETIVYILDRATRTWTVKQRLPTYGAMSLDIITYPLVSLPGTKRRTYLAIANGLSTNGKPHSSLVFVWDFKAKLFRHFDTIETWSARSVLFVPHKKDLLLVFANEKANLDAGQCGSDDLDLLNPYESLTGFYTQPVDIYVLKDFENEVDHGFHLHQSINLPGVNTLDRLYLPSETYLLLGSKLYGKTYIYQYRGFNRFQEVKSLVTPGVSSLLSYWSSDGHLFLAVSSTKPGHSKIYKAVIRGPKPSQFHFSSLKHYFSANPL